MKGKLTLLGTGGSMGVPVIGCKCEICTSNHPRNKRMRCSCLLETAGKKILIDVGPDFRTQALLHKLDHLDALLITHAHQDHVAGMDDLRPLFFERGSPLPCYLSPATFGDVKARFPYVFNGKQHQSMLLPKLDVHLLEGERGTVPLAGSEFSYTTYEQGGMPVNGFRFGNLAYLSDISKYSESVKEDVRGVDTLIISALRFTPSHIHFTVDEAIDFAREVGAKQTWLTHLAHELEYEKGSAYLPEGIALAYDGLQLEF